MLSRNTFDRSTRASGEPMAKTLTLAGNPSVMTQDLEVTSKFVKGTRTAPSEPQRKSKTPGATPLRILRWRSKPTHQRFSVASEEHPLGAVKHAPLFRDLSLSECREIAAEGHERIFLRNETIFVEGDPLRSVSMITAGHAKTIRHSATGKIMIFNLCGRGDVLDGLGSFPGSKHCVEARAVQRCGVLSWDIGVFESLSNRLPVLRRNSTRLLLGSLRMLEGRFQELATERIPQRLAKILLRLILQGRGSVRASLIDLTGEDLAQIVGTTQFTVSRLLCDWAAKGIIQPERSAILVENFPGLIAVAMQVECGE
jgi:CRP/FNR family transcriptional regulator, nitrogen oxide reductase regulator